MPEQSNQSNREAASINEDAAEDSLTLGSPEAKEKGLDYQFVSDIARQVASESASETPRNVEQKPSTGREPEDYYHKQTPER
jgi:hypothetical protein